jgi:hypothetical protein
MAVSDGLRAWAASGAMALTGRSAGPPLAAPGTPTLSVRRSLEQVAASALARTGRSFDLPGAELLGERAAVLGLERQGPVSCGGSFRTVATTDGWFGLSLARDEDVELVPALVGEEAAGDPWPHLARWASTRPRAEAAQDALQLGLPAAAWPPADLTERPAVVSTPGGRRSGGSGAPLVVDLTSLWAGPLCGHLLGLTGCRVVKVESTHRPDGSRRGPAGFFDLLHGGHAMVAVDLGDPADVGRLAELVSRADLVLESSRPRALRQLGLDAQGFVNDGVGWVSITARGRADDAVGFGDDVAVAAGLAVELEGDLLPVGDAVADPMTGVRAAAAASALLLEDRAALLDVSMLHTVREAVARDPGPVPHEVREEQGQWWVHTDDASFPIAPPVARQAAEAARLLGADTAEWLA